MIQAKKKKANKPKKMAIKYGIEVPWNTKHAIKLDEKGACETEVGGDSRPYMQSEAY